MLVGRGDGSCHSAVIDVVWKLIDFEGTPARSFLAFLLLPQ
jgi:hypothetical protein